MSDLMKLFGLPSLFLVMILLLGLIFSQMPSITRDDTIYTFPEGMTPVFRRGTSGGSFICVDTDGVYQDCEAVITYKGE